MAGFRKSVAGVPASVWAALAAVSVVNVVAHLAVLPSLPAQVPVHWGASGAVDGWGPSWSTTAFGAVPLGMLALFYVVPQVDPKACAYAAAGRFYLGFVCAMTAIMCGMSWLGELTVWGCRPRHGLRQRPGWCGGRPFAGGRRQLPAARAPELHHGGEDSLGARRSRQLASHPALWRRLPDGRGRRGRRERSCGVASACGLGHGRDRRRDPLRGRGPRRLFLPAVASWPEGVVAGVGRDWCAPFRRRMLPLRGRVVMRGAVRHVFRKRVRICVRTPP